MAKILIIEDDAQLADCYKRWLLHAKHNIELVGNAQQAIDFLDENDVDLILLDLFLPRANGLQLLHLLQSYPDIAKIPVVLFSANLPQALSEEMQAYGVQKVVDKTTLSRVKLSTVIEEVIKNATV